jgi:mannose-6-phosphate isomerase-like protein (cupin superfamily)
MEIINLNDKYNKFREKWSPYSVAELNGQQVLLAKVEGEFVWHAHEKEDELFYVVKGKLFIEFRDKTVELSSGEMIVVPKGVEHRPRAEEEAWILLFEPLGIKHSGNVTTEITKSFYPKI